MTMEGCFVTIVFVDDNLMISSLEIDGRIDGTSGYLVEDLIDEWYRVDILDGCIV